MSLRLRLALLVALLMLLPAVPAALVTRQLIGRSLDLGLSAQADAALEAGLRSARRELQRERADLQALADAWARTESAPGIDGSSRHDFTAARPDGVRPGDRVLLRLAGTERVLQPGDLGPDERPAESTGREPPFRITATSDVIGGRLEMIRAVDASWREDAALLASQLQVIRGLAAERQRLERSFWLPFVAIYGLALLVGSLLALRLGRGITGPVGRLLHATEAVAAGDWTVQVEAPGHDEIGRLADRFDAMVRTLDAQSRALVDLQTMSGWREMARALAHEVKNPLTPIQLTVEEMRQRYEGDDAEYRALLEECTRIVVEEVSSLRNVVERFREFSRPVEPQLRRVDLARLVSDVAALQRDLTVELELAEDVGEIVADPDRLRQMLMNLTENARKATRGESAPRLGLTAHASERGVDITVEDNGPGIPEHEWDRVFEPYRSGSAQGLGLGLALVKGIVLAHRGAITVDQGRWGGARFRIELPRDGGSA